MKKLTIIFKDNSRVIYTMKDSVDWVQYFQRHSRSSIESAVLQRYPKKNYEPVVLV